MARNKKAFEIVVSSFPSGINIFVSGWKSIQLDYQKEKKFK